MCWTTNTQIQADLFQFFLALFGSYTFQCFCLFVCRLASRLYIYIWLLFRDDVCLYIDSSVCLYCCIRVPILSAWISTAWIDSSNSIQLYLFICCAIRWLFSIAQWIWHITGNVIRWTDCTYVNCEQNPEWSLRHRLVSHSLSFIGTISGQMRANAQTGTSARWWLIVWAALFEWFSGVCECNCNWNMKNAYECECYAKQ